MSDDGDNRMAQNLYTDSAEFKSHMGTVRFVSDWVKDTHSGLDSLTVPRLRVRLSELDVRYERFTHACSELLGSLDQNIDGPEYEYIRRQTRSVRDMVDDLKIKYNEVYPKPDVTEPGASSTPLRQAMPARPTMLDPMQSRLPDLPIPKFDGRPESWISFLDQFDSVVDSQPMLTPIVKLQYLLGSLTDEPRRLLQHLRIEADNYDTARDLLKRRYHNTRILADNYIIQILTLPELNSKLTGLRATFLNPMFTAYRGLERLKLPVAQWSYMLVHICLTKLPSDLRSRFERRYGDRDGLPEFSQLLTFLEDECRHHDNVGNASLVDASPSSPNRPRQRSPIIPIYPRHTRTYTTTVPSNAPAPSSRLCYLCSSDSHYLRECPDFRHLSPRDRASFVKEARLCYRCLDKHSIAYCQRDYRCGTCHRTTHHTLLCFNDPRSPTYPESRNQPSVSFNDGAFRNSRSPSPRKGGGVFYRSDAPRKSPQPTRTTYSSARRSPTPTRESRRYRSPPPARRDYSPAPSQAERGGKPSYRDMMGRRSQERTTSQ